MATAKVEASSVVTAVFKPLWLGYFEVNRIFYASLLHNIDRRNLTKEESFNAKDGEYRHISKYDCFPPKRII